MSVIYLKSILCTLPDEIDMDEIYLKLNGKKIWPEAHMYKRVDSGDEVDIGLEMEVEEGWITLELWDFDYMSRNDFLGEFKFKVDNTPGKYSTSMILKEKNSTASYILNWLII